MAAPQAALKPEPAGDEIRSRPCPDCCLCGKAGEPLYQGLRDRLYSAPGTWNLRRCPDAACGLVWLDPMPLKEGLHKAYATYYTHAVLPDTFTYRFRQRIKRGYAGLAYGYSRRVPLLDRLLAFPVLFLPWFREQTATTHLMYLRGEKPGKLLEIGFGGAAFLIGMRELGWQVEGIDMDPQAVEKARRIYGLSVRQGELSEQRYPDASFDAITMSHVIEHVPDPIGLLRECRRILAPGGRLVITTPNTAALGHRKFGSAWVHLDPPRHLHLFSIVSLEESLRRAGFEDIGARSSMRWAGGVWTISESIRRDGVTTMSARGGLRMRLTAMVFQMFETLILQFDGQVGEEVIGSARVSGKN